MTVHDWFVQLAPHRGKETAGTLLGDWLLFMELVDFL